MFGILKRKRRERLRAKPFPPEWRRILERSLPLFSKLSKPDQQELQGHIQVFLAEKNFEGCGGLEITDEIRVTVAAHACLLLLHRRTDYYPRLSSILVYPSPYLAKEMESTDYGVVSERESSRLGESWRTGSVVLSWDSASQGATDIRDGQNVILHEFAHQLDQEDGIADGAPILGRGTRYVTWARVFGAEFERLRLDDEQGRSTVLDKYGATDPAEFFAVATECFFEQPQRLHRKHPKLYNQLKQFYRQDPAKILEGSSLKERIASTRQSI